MGHLLFDMTFCFILFVACSKEKDDPVDRTIIVYMAADDILSKDATKNLKAMQDGYKEKGANLVVFIDDPANNSRQIQRIGGSSNTILKTYTESNSVYADQLGKVLNDVISMYPSKSYGLILWSHGSSWLPASMQKKAFGPDENRKMNISDMTAELPVRFDFILIDACLMGSVEVAYELRNHTDYIIASPAEIFSTGFPYKQIIPELLQNEPNLSKIVDEYFNYYNQKKNDYDKSATVSLISTHELENLAAITRQMIGNRTFNFSSSDHNLVQRLEFLDTQYISSFDFLDFLEKAFPDADSEPLKAQLDKTVLYKKHTLRFFDEYEIIKFCGLSSYIPNPNKTWPWNDWNTYYKQLEWCQASGFDRLFK